MYAASSAIRRPRIGSLGLPMGKLGMWVFLASEIMFFAGLIDSYIVLRFSTPAWPNPSTRLSIQLTAFMTFVLICSSGTMVLALSRIQAGDPKGLKFWLGMTILGGLTFLGCQFHEYTDFLITHHIRPSQDLFWGTFFTLTGFHGFHVTCGVVARIWAFAKACLGHFDAHGHEAVELVGLYWHFVDLVWIILFTIVYLI